MVMGSSPPEQKLADQLTRLMLTAHDIRYALSAATFLLQDVDYEQSYSLADMRRFHCYETTMVVAYGRPFSQSRNRLPVFAWKHAGVKLTDEEKTLHEKLITHRNKLHAHSDADFIDIRKQVWSTALPEGRSFDYVVPRFDEGLRFDEGEVNAIHKFLWRARAALDEAVQKAPASREGFQVIDINLTK